MKYLILITEVGDYCYIVTDSIECIEIEKINIQVYMKSDGCNFSFPNNDNNRETVLDFIKRTS